MHFYMFDIIHGAHSHDFTRYLVIEIGSKIIWILINLMSDF